MDIAQSGLQTQPFHDRGQPAVFIPYHAQLAAHHFLKLILNDERGVGVFYGPESAGKKTIVDEFIRSLPAEIPVAIVDAARLKTLDLLTAIMAQLDPGPSFDSVDGYWYALKIFLAEKTRSGRPPLLVLRNINKMYPSALYALCKLAELQVEGRYLLRIILTSDQAPFSVIRSPAMAAVSGRSIGAFELGPLTSGEALTYVRSKLRAAGSDEPDRLIPPATVEALHKAANGWPGQLDRLALDAIERAENWPIIGDNLVPPAPDDVEIPRLTAVVEPVEHAGITKLFLTLNGNTLQEIKLSETKVLIGRSELCDVMIDSRFVSKCHAILIRTNDALHLLDLNSRNGVFVNSQRVLHQTLRHDDVISIGNHGIKLVCPSRRRRAVIESQDLAETASMRTLPELRELRDNAGEDDKVAEIPQRS